MKLRFDTNSLRLRLRKSDVAQLHQFGMVQNKVCFSENNILQFALKIENVETIVAEYTSEGIVVYLPKQLALQWMDSDLVNLEHQQFVSENRHLHILIEKDFPCRHTSTDDVADTFFELSG